MSEKGTGAARAGFGRYEWTTTQGSALVSSLRITIEEMTTLPEESAEPILRWAQTLPYPWCPREPLAQGAPEIAAIERISAALA